ncbi:MAG: ubiquitin-activating E1 FCCH domain-containing protein [Calothrix sp. MO_167.B12]|nr:ubiquitin-activating E1 FCCH domain-containing protein [Calothrix sp. MO_167.B12]
MTSWKPQGPAPAQNGQVENVQPNNEVVGAIHTVIADPHNANILYAGAVNGGIWKTETATYSTTDNLDNDDDGLVDEADETVNWKPLTDNLLLPANSIGAMEFDPTDPSNQTIIAGIGRFSAFPFLGNGGPLTGLLKTTDGGHTWTQLGTADNLDNDDDGSVDENDETLLLGRNISGLASHRHTILVSANDFGGGIDGGVYRSTDNGASWKFISDSSGLAAGAAFDLVDDPTNNQRFYVSVKDVGIFLSEDAGDNWINISANDPSLNAVITGGRNNNTEMAVASNGRLYVAVLTNGQPSYIGFTDNSTANNPTWTEMDLPLTPEPVSGTPTDIGLNPTPKPGGQGAIHFSIVADPDNPNIVYVGGDRQGIPQAPNTNTTFPTFVGAQDFSGRLFRGDTNVPASPSGSPSPSPQWEHLTHSNSIAAIPNGGTTNNSAPHADSREMTFDANGDIIEVDDGGIYRRTSPEDNTGDWFSLNGNLQVTEQHDIAYDTVSNIIISGNQDTGTTQQTASGSLIWDSVSTADGGDVAVDTTSRPGFSIRYSSFQNLTSFRRIIYDANNNVVSLPITGATNAPMGQPIVITSPNHGLTTGARVIISGVTGNTAANNTPNIPFFTVTVIDNNQFSLQDTTGNNNISGSGNYTGGGGIEQVQPARTLVGGGNPLQTQFTTPIEVNNVAGSQLVIGGANSVYESFNQGNTITEVRPTGLGLSNRLNVNTMTYGGRRNGGNNPGVLYVGGDEITPGNVLVSNRIFVRNTAGGTLTNTNYGGGSVRDIVLDSDDWMTGFAIDNDQVFQTTDGNNWIDITGNLQEFATNLGLEAADLNLQSIEFIPGSSGVDGIVVGTNFGIFSAISNDFTDWLKLGTDLPNVPVWDMDYDPQDDLLVAGTLGRGAWTLSNASVEITLGVTKIGTSNDDKLRGTLRNDILKGLDGEDILKGLAGDDLLDGGDGDDKLFAGDGNDTLLGGDGEDRLFGEAGNDKLDGGDDDDTLIGGNGDDTLIGGDGDDTLLGEAGNDKLDGSKDDDKLSAGDGNDTLIGGEGDDTLLGEAGNDKLNGGEDDDKLSAGDGDDTLIGGDGDDTLLGEAGNDKLDGGEDSDKLSAGDGDDTLIGGDGDDKLFGGQGQDQLFGDAGDDLLYGGTGDNTMTGGADNDIFVLSTEGKNNIIDFQDGQDLLGLTGGLTFESLSIFGQNNGTFINTSNNQPLAFLANVNPNLLTADDFITVETHIY